MEPTGNINKSPENTADHDLRLVWGDDGQPYWFTGITSSSGSDDTMVAFMMMNSRTGETRYYKLSGSTEKAVKETAGKSVSNFKGWNATDPVLYNLYGHLAWVVPVVTDEGIFKALAIVRHDTMQVVLGANRYEALREFQKSFAGSGNQIVPGSKSALKKVTIKVDRFGIDFRGGLYLIVSNQMPGKVFLGEASTSQEIPLTQVGDTVEVQYMDTEQPSVTILGFDNPALRLETQTEKK